MAAFGPESTTDDVLEGVDLTGQRILVTGASAGLGVETTRALAAHGASVTMAVRDLAKGAAAMEEVARRACPAPSSTSASSTWPTWPASAPSPTGSSRTTRRLDVLIGNAGIMACPQGTTVDGFELQFGTNHLGHFLLVTRLLPALVARRRRPGGAAQLGRPPLRRRRPRRPRLRAHSPTTRGWPTAGPRRPTCCARSASTSASATRACGPSPSTPAGSRPSSAATSPSDTLQVLMDRLAAAPARDGVEVGAPGRRHHRVRRHLARPRRPGRRVPRGLPRRRAHRRPRRPRGRARLRPRPGPGRRAVGPVRAARRDEVHLRGGDDRPELLPAARPGGRGGRASTGSSCRTASATRPSRRPPTRTRPTATGASSRTSRSSSRSRSSRPWAPSPSASASSISVLKLTVRHPVLVAKQAASTAVLTDDRLTLGIGTSPWPEDYEVCDVPFERRGQAGRREHRRHARAAHRRLVRVPRRDLRRARGSSSARCPPRRSRSSSAATPSRPCGGRPRNDGWIHGGGDPEALPGLITRLHELRAEEGREPATPSRST